jgi:sigma-E factor negative regulatory protein RseB
MRCVHFALLIVVGVFAAPVMADEALDWLNRLAAAERTQSYQGTFIYERNGSFSSHTVWRRADESGLQERLLQLDGPPQEVLKVNGEVRCVSGSLADQLDASKLWPARTFDPEVLARSYDVRLTGQSRVAGRAAVVLALLPKDQHRYGIELHVDMQSGLPLKSLLLSDKGLLLERYQFTRLDTTTPAAKSLEPGAGCEPLRVALEQVDVQPGWQSDWLPAGFDLLASTRRRSPASDQHVASLVYGDGLARFSVFIEPLQGAAVEDLRSQVGPTTAVSRRLKNAKGDVMVTVVGEIPMGTAERVALSIRVTDSEPVQ